MSHSCLNVIKMTAIRMDLCTISSSFTELKCLFSFRCLNSVCGRCAIPVCVYLLTFWIVSCTLTRVKRSVVTEYHFENDSNKTHLFNN